MAARKGVGRIYGVLLRVFPRAFRARFGAQMTADFEARHATAMRRGAAATIALWLRTLADVLHGAWQRGTPSGGRARGVAPLAHDARHALRLLRRQPGLATTAIVTLSVGIGLNVAILSIANAVFRKSLPLPSPEQLVTVGEAAPERPDTPHAFNPANLADLKPLTAGTFASIAAYRYRLDADAVLTGDGHDAVGVITRPTEPDIFDVLGIGLAQGRPLTRADVDAHAHAAVASAAFWRTWLGADPQAVGRRIELDGQPWTIVGVLPDGADFTLTPADLWVPLVLSPADQLSRNSWFLNVIARLRPGVTIAQADATVKRGMAAVTEAAPGPAPTTGVVRSQQQTLVALVRSEVLFAQAVAACVLLIAAVNLTNLMLASATTRQQEFSVRTALGAARGRLVRQVLTENLVLGLCGAVGGSVAAALLGPALASAYPGRLPGGQHITVGSAELAAAALLSVAMCLVFGSIPAFLASHPRQALAATARAGASRAASRLRAGLVAAEVTITIMLLVGALLLTRSFVRLTHQDAGFDGAHVTAASLTLPNNAYPSASARQHVVAVILDRLRASSVIDRAAAAFPVAFDGVSMGSTMRWDPALGLAAPLSAGRRYASDDWLDVMGVRLLRGRFFTTADRADAAPVAVVNASFAARYGTDGRDVIGMRFLTDASKPMTTIVGVIADTRSTFERASSAELILPLSQNPLGMTSFLMKSQAPLRVVNERYRSIVREQFPGLVAHDARPLADIADASVSDRRYNMTLLGALAALAMALSVVGIYGVTAYVVSQRRREMAVRVALGAQPSSLRMLSMRQGGVPIVIGVVVGLVGAWNAASLLQRQLFQVTPRDPWTLGAAATSVLAVGLIACWVPARRAGRVNPVDVLKAE